MEKFVCPNCGNSNPRYIGIKNHKPYCRLCVTMKPKEKLIPQINQKPCKVALSYALTNEQKNIAVKVCEEYQKHYNVLIYAVTGAGKTELIYGVMQYALTHGMQVGFAVPRREVAIELYDRINESFVYNSVCCVCGGHHDVLVADIVVLTTHQLYRYENFFDLLILDEIDAFPFKDNQLLNSMFFKSIRGNYVLMSATPNKETLNYFKRDGHTLLTLKTRYHNHVIPVPVLIKESGINKYIELVKNISRLIKNNKRVFVFTPTISECENLYLYLSKFIKNGNYVHSKRMNQSSIIKQFKNGNFKYLVTTAVLERGITVKGLQVIIFNADHRIYDEYSLVQIAGRVGRKIDEPEGEVIFIANKETNEIKKAIATIRECNAHL